MQQAGPGADERKIVRWKHEVGEVQGRVTT